MGQVVFCENRLCVYWEQGNYQLGIISVGARGSCESCIEMQLSERVLNAARKKLRCRYDREDSDV